VYSSCWCAWSSLAEKQRFQACRFDAVGRFGGVSRHAPSTWPRMLVPSPVKGRRYSSRADHRCLLPKIGYAARRVWTISSKPSITMVGGVRSDPAERASSSAEFGSGYPMIRPQTCAATASRRPSSQPPGRKIRKDVRGGRGGRAAKPQPEPAEQQSDPEIERDARGAARKSQAPGANTFSAFARPCS
jgi:hypothetical protein